MLMNTVLPFNAKVVHAGFDDPSKLAEKVTGEAEKLNYYRKVRDEISAFVENLPGVHDT